MSTFRQAFSWWCNANRGIEPAELLAGAARIGFAGVDLLDEVYWPLAKDHGLAIAAVAGHGSIEDGLNRRENAQRIENELRESIAKAHQWDISAIVCFSGNRHGASDEEGMIVCAETLGRVAPEAEAAGVTLIMELLNSRVDHVGYQCDRTEWGVRLCERVGSPAVKLLYDIYHLQIMEGDLLRTIETNFAHLAYFHTAGNPGRHFPGPDQEIQYVPIYRKLRDLGFTGWLSHEFVPQGNPLDELAAAFAQCCEAF